MNSLIEFDLSYHVDPTLLRKAMVQASQELQKGTSRRSLFQRAAGTAALAVSLGVSQIALQRLYDIEVLNAGFFAGAAFATLLLLMVQQSAIQSVAQKAVDTAAMRGPTRFTSGPSGLSERSGIGRIDVVWEAIDGISDIKHGTVIRFGALCFVVPDSALPPEIPPDRFRAQLETWRRASEVFG